MNEIILQNLTEAGTYGVMIVGLSWFSKKLFSYFMEQQQKLYIENQQLEMQFRDYLIQNNKEHHEILKRNTKAYETLVLLIDKHLKTLSK